MNESLRNAIETVDSARQHKCELEGRLGQLNACISQVTVTSARTKKDIKLYFSELQAKIIEEIKLRTKELTDQVTNVEKEALEPLEECKQILTEGIQETTSVIENGENLIHNENDIKNQSDVKKLNKFINVANSLSLDSVPEVPSITDVACVSIRFENKEFKQEVCTMIKSIGDISKQGPVQISELTPRPGGMIVSWDENDGDVSSEWIENGNGVLYKLQYCTGKVTLTSDSYGRSDSHHFFRDCYVGKNMKHTVKKLLPNTVYTFRVSRCFVEVDGTKTKEHWSPWSVYQDGITILPGYEWANVTEKEGYKILDKGRAASKTSSKSQILYSKEGGYIVGHPITFNIELDGPSLNAGDGFALVTKIDPTTTTIVRNGTICVASDGRIFINGTESKTRFANFCRNTHVQFNAYEMPVENGNVGAGAKSKKGSTTLRVSISVMDKEAVFDWKVPSSALTGSSNKPCLSFAAAFKSSNWKFNVI